MRLRKRRHVIGRAAVLLLVISGAPAAFALEGLLWVRQYGTLTGADEMEGIACDADDNVYISGRFSGTVDFDPEAGVTSLSAIGTSDAYITRYDRDGRLTWARQIGGTGFVSVASTGGIASDGGGFLYISGSFSGTADFDPGPGTFEMTAISGPEVFYLVKLTTAGDFVWARQTSCPGSSVGVQAIAANAESVALTGTLIGTCDFDPGPAVAQITEIAGDLNAFVDVLDADGSFVWATPFESTGADIPSGIAIDAAGSVYTIARAGGSIDYDPGPRTDLQTGNMFVVKQSPTGAEQWARVLVGASTRPFGVTTDRAGSVYVAGQFSSTVDFDPGPGTANRTVVGGSTPTDGFVWKLDAAGGFNWVATHGSATTDVTRKVVVTPDGRIHAVGQFSGTADFDPGAGTFNLASAGNSDGFVLALDSAGQFVSAVRVGGPLADLFTDITADRGGHVVAFGSFAGTADFDPGPGVSNLTSTGGVDVFIWKHGLSELRLTGAGTGPTTIAFMPGSPAFYDIVRGRLSDLRSNANYSQAACFGGELTAPATDPETPPAGDGFYYLARGRNCCLNEAYGDSTIVPDPRDALDFGPCP